MHVANTPDHGTCAYDTGCRLMLLPCTGYTHGQTVTCLCTIQENIDLTASLVSSSSLSESSLKSHVHTRANATAIATTAAQRYALAKLDVHVATMVSVH